MSSYLLFKICTNTEVLYSAEMLYTVLVVNCILCILQTTNRNSKGRFTSFDHYAMKAYGSGCIDPHFLDLGTSWR
jgi:hypothetical protein